jgi:hypothetical protein
VRAAARLLIWPDLALLILPSKHWKTVLDQDAALQKGLDRRSRNSKLHIHDRSYEPARIKE